MKDIKQLYIDDMNFLSAMYTKEYYLYKKWEEVNELSLTSSQKNILWQISKSLYVFNDPQDYLKIRPVITHVKTKDQQFIWRMLRIHTSTLSYNNLPGRNCRYYVKDGNTNTYLGVFGLSSDFMDVGDRNKYIGWTKEQILKKGMLKHTAIGSTIVPTQPFGFNYIGGKLMALLIASDVVVDSWNDKYPETLAGITTTSIYGGKSQYNSLPYWRKCKTSQGGGMLMSSNKIYKMLQNYLREAYPEKYMNTDRKSGGIRNQKRIYDKETVMAHIARDFGLAAPKRSMPKGVYFNCLYDNTREFLRCEDTELGEMKYDNSVAALTDVWKKKCSNRVKNLSNRNGFLPEHLFYDDLARMSWKDSKDKYL